MISKQGVGVGEDVSVVLQEDSSENSVGSGFEESVGAS